MASIPRSSSTDSTAILVRRHPQNLPFRFDFRRRDRVRRHAHSSARADKSIMICFCLSLKESARDILSGAHKLRPRGGASPGGLCHSGRLLYNSGMAAATDPASRASFAELVDLRELRSWDVADLLQEEIETWRTALDWDFRASADLVRRFLDQRSLSGYALTARGKVVGYAYFVHDERKGLIGDLYVRRSHATPEHERQLLSAVVEQLMRSPYVGRIETQLMLAGANIEPLPGARFLKAYDRRFMREPTCGNPGAGDPRRSAFTSRPGRTGIRNRPRI